MRAVETTLLTRLGAFVRLGRPIFLVGGFVLYGLGAAIAAARGYEVNWPRFAWGQLAVTSIQLMTHYANDYFDLEADRANVSPTRWSGGSRVLPNGELSPTVALGAAIALACISLLATWVLCAVLSAGDTVAVLLLASLALAWAYSAPPVRLHSRGLGEIDTVLIMTLLVPLTGFCLQARALQPAALLAVAPLCLLQFAMLLAVEFPDEIGDTLVGKRTLVVRMGARRAGKLYQFAVWVPYLSLPVLIGLGLPRPAALALFATFPLAVWVSAQVGRGEHCDPRSWNRLAFSTTALFVGSALFETGAFLAIAGARP